MVIRKMKDKCKDAARMRREKERAEFVELSKLLPLPSSTTSQLDKASIIRLTSSYLRLRAAFPKGLGEHWGTPRAAMAAATPAASWSSSSLSSSSPPNYNARVASSCLSSAEHHSNSVASSHVGDEAAVSGELQAGNSSRTDRPQHCTLDTKHAGSRNQITHSHSTNQTHIRELGSLILQTLDGFVFALHRDGKIMYISETASVLLGLPQIDLTGSSIFEYVHPADHNDLVDLLSLNELDRLEIDEQLGEAVGQRLEGAPPHLELGRSFCMRMKCILPKRNAGLSHNGYKVIHCSGYLKVRRRGTQPLCSLTGTINGGNSGSGIGGVKGSSPVGHEQDWDSYALVAVGHSLLPSASVEIKLNTASFMFRAHLDLSLSHIEAPATSLLGHQQADFLGRSLYQFVHLADSHLLEQAHRSLLSKSQVVSRYFRLMRNSEGAGFVWMQLCACLISNPRSIPRSQHIVGVCWLIGEDQLDESRSILPPAPREEPVRQTSTSSSSSSSSNSGGLPRTVAAYSSSACQLSTREGGQSRDLLVVATQPETERGAHDATGKRQQAKDRPQLGGASKRTKKTQERVAKVARLCRDQRKIGERTDQHARRQLLTQSQQFSRTIGSLRRPSEDSSSIISSIASTSTSSRPPTAAATTAGLSFPCSTNAGLMISSQGPSVSCSCPVPRCAASVCSSSSSSSSSAASSSGIDPYSPNKYAGQLSQYNTTSGADNLIYADSENMASLSSSEQPIYLLHPTYRYGPESYTTAYTQDLHDWPTTTTIGPQQSHAVLEHTSRPSHITQHQAPMHSQYYTDHGLVSDSDGALAYYDHQTYSGNHYNEYRTYETHQGNIVQAATATCFVGGHQGVL